MIDLTKKRLYSFYDGRMICQCPNCGRKGQRRISPSVDGKQEIIYVHKAHIDFRQAFVIDESCKIIREVTAKVF